MSLRVSGSGNISASKSLSFDVSSVNGIVSGNVNLRPIAPATTPIFTTTAIQSVSIDSNNIGYILARGNYNNIPMSLLTLQVYGPNSAAPGKVVYSISATNGSTQDSGTATFSTNIVSSAADDLITLLQSILQQEQANGSEIHLMRVVLNPLGKE